MNLFLVDHFIHISLNRICEGLWGVGCKNTQKTFSHRTLQVPDLFSSGLTPPLYVLQSELRLNNVICWYIWLVYMLHRLDIDLPVNGEYGLEVYYNDPAGHDNNYTYVCQYLLIKPREGDITTAVLYQAPSYKVCYNVHGVQEPFQPVTVVGGMITVAVSQM